MTSSDDDTDLPRPQYRATLADGKLLFADWTPFLARRYGPFGQLLDQAEIAAIADLTILRDEADRLELIVAELRGAAEPALRSALVRWATLLGYRRVWFADDLVEPDPSEAGAGRRVRTRCLACASSWSEDAPEFWLGARQTGVFPAHCPVCGHTMPQWSLAEDDAPPRERAPASTDDAELQHA